MVNLYTDPERIASGRWDLCSGDSFSLIIATSAIALQLGTITSATTATMVLVAVLTCTLSPLLFAWLLSGPEPETRQGVIVRGTDLSGARATQSVWRSRHR